jgi:hypothetical protein
MSEICQQDQERADVPPSVGRTFWSAPENAEKPIVQGTLRDDRDDASARCDPERLGNIALRHGENPGNVFPDRSHAIAINANIRNLYRMRIRYTGNKQVTSLIGVLIEQLKGYRTATGEHKANLDRMMMRTIRELGEATGCGAFQED